MQPPTRRKLNQHEVENIKSNPPQLTESEITFLKSYFDTKLICGEDVVFVLVFLQLKRKILFGGDNIGNEYFLDDMCVVLQVINDGANIFFQNVFPKTAQTLVIVFIDNDYNEKIITLEEKLSKRLLDFLKENYHSSIVKEIDCLNFAFYLIDKPEPTQGNLRGHVLFVENFNCGDIVIFFNEYLFIVHWAVYLSDSVCVSKYGVNGDIVFSSVDQCCITYKAFNYAKYVSF